jgi:hypothetical protein
LYDAIGRGIGILDEAMEGKVGAKAILVIMTDRTVKKMRHASSVMRRSALF